MSRRIITLTTDFGYAGHFAGAMKGVMLGIAAQAQIVDITHDIPPFDVLEGALTIASAAPYFPEGTIHVVVVDPGVGTERRAILAEAGGQFFIAPDNGVLGAALEQGGSAKVRHITAEKYFAKPVSRTFHGRDIFAPAAAWLAKSGDAAAFGNEISDYARLELPRPQRGNGVVTGAVLRVDRFGNLMTNVRPEDVREILEGNAEFTLRLGGKEVRRVVKMFAEGAAGEAVLMMGSSGYLEIAVNGGSAAELLGAGPRKEFTIHLGKAGGARE